jgi:hypothetical protein
MLMFSLTTELVCMVLKFFLNPMVKEQSSEKPNKRGSASHGANPCEYESMWFKIPLALSRCGAKFFGAEFSWCKAVNLSPSGAKSPWR